MITAAISKYLTIACLLLLFSQANGIETDSHTGQSAALRAAGRLPLDICKAEWGDEEILCGTYDVWENHELKTGRKISLNIVVIPSLAERPEPDPIFDFDGGPGLPSTNAAEYYAKYAPFRNTRDIVLVDFRGTGKSNPLHCELVADRSSLQSFLAEMYPPDLVTRCRSELEKISDLAQYTTESAAADIEEVRAWLGYEKINIIAVSYGGRAAYVYARRHPERVRSILMMGPASIDTKMPMYHAPLAERTFKRLCQDCLADSACNVTFPDIEMKLRAVVERLRAVPAVVSYAHPELSQAQQVSVSPETFVEFLRSMLYSNWSRRRIPYIVQQAYDGNFIPFLDAAIPEKLNSEPVLAEGMYLSVTGAEDAPFIDPGEAIELSAGTLLGTYRIDQQRRAAALWPRGDLPTDYFDEVLLDVPVLVIQGENDPVIPPGQAVRRFQNGREIIVPNMAHVPEDSECLLSLLESFLNDPDPAKLDVECLNDISLPPFRLSADD